MAAVPRPRTQRHRIDTETSWLFLEDETTEARLLVSVAKVLGISTDDVRVDVSFCDLGGNEQSAIELHKACLDAGLDVAVKDILRCSSLSELQTCITPLVQTDAVRPVIQPTRPVPNIPKEGAQVTSIRSPGGMSDTSVERTEIELALGPQPEIGRIATVRPKAGLLEGKLVALLTLLSVEPTPQDGVSTIHLVPHSHAILSSTLILHLKEVAASRLPQDAIPDAWIVLESMPLTDDGKINMRLLRTWVQNINEDVYHRARSLEQQDVFQPPQTDMEHLIHRLASKVLSIPSSRIGVNFSFCQLGGNEQSAQDFVSLCRLEPLHLTLPEVLSSMTLSELAAMAAARSNLEHEWNEPNLDCFGLSPMQHLYFETNWGGDRLLRAARDGTYRFNQSLLLRVKQPVTYEAISSAIRTLVSHHPMLRARFRCGRQGWAQRILPEVTGSYQLLFHSGIRTSEDLEEIIEQTQLAIDIEMGPVFAANYIMTDDGDQLIYLIAHHLVVDLWSWRVIIHDFDELLQNGRVISEQSTGFQKWIEMRKASAVTPTLESLLNLSTKFPGDYMFKGDYAYWGVQDIRITYGHVRDTTFELSYEHTHILETVCNQVFQTESVDIYLAALMLSFAKTFHDRRVPVVWNEEPDRGAWNPDIDVSGTVGWFTLLCPISLAIEPSADFIDVLRRLKDKRRSIPEHGSRYFASRFYHYDKDEIRKYDQPFEIIFRYTGSQQLEPENGVLEKVSIPGRRSLISPTADTGDMVGRIALFEISCVVDQGKAFIRFLWDTNSPDMRVERWIENYQSVLYEAIDRLRFHPPELTLTDVPDLNVTYEGLAQFHAERLAVLRLPSVREIEAIYPITAVQQSILICQLLRPDSCYLHAIYEFSDPTGEPIDDRRICEAWKQVVARHAALRTVFTESVCERALWDMVILRKTHPDMMWFEAGPTEDPIAMLNGQAPLKVTEYKPLHRLAVCTSPTKTFVKLDISAALCDSISLSLLFHDLQRAYTGELPIKEPELFTYPQYIYFLGTARSEPSRDYWRDNLMGLSPCHFPHLTLQGDQLPFSTICVSLDVGFSELSNFVELHHSTIGSLLRLAWAIILRSYTGSNQTIFGFQASGRDDSVIGMKHAVGSFAHIIPCNYDLEPYDPLTKALEMIDLQYEERQQHQYFSLADLQHAIGMKGGERLFNTCLIVEQPVTLNSKFTKRTRLISLQQSLDFDVVVNVRFASGKLVVDIGQRIMSPEQAVNLAHTLGQAIRAIIKYPNTSIALVDLFTSRDREQISAWREEGSHRASQQTLTMVHTLIENKARAQPQAQAVYSWDGAFTYEQLEEEATKLARWLRHECYVDTHTVVPVVMDKCRLAPVAMLAVLKTGATFVPIDSLELGMIQPIFERLNTNIAISSERPVPVLTNLFEKVVVLTESFMKALPSDLPPFSATVTFSDPACIFFCASSSSEARGITFSHAALSTALLGQGPAAKIGPESRVMQLSSFNVDICITEIFTTLVHGGCVCIPSNAERLQDFGAAVSRLKVNWSYMTPHLSRKIIPAQTPSLKVVCFRTRNLDEDTYLIWHGRVSVILAYGPLEGCPLGIAFLEALVPQHLKCIGRPFAGDFILVNPDDQKKNVPVGAVGELILKGPTLGVAYPNRESTLSPMSPVGTSMGMAAIRYFRPRHLARYIEGGLMEFILKDREDAEGSNKYFNVSITEVEQHVRRCLRQMALDVSVELILFRTPIRTDPELVAFVELGDGIGPEETLGALSLATREQLAIIKQKVYAELKNIFPRNLIPAIFVPVRHLPVTTSLKINHRRLQRMISGMSREDLLNLSSVIRTDARFQYLKPLPLTASEERMRNLWAQVLGLEAASISATDRFFAIGGDEIMAVELVLTCRQEGILVSVADVLSNVTLTELSRRTMVTTTTITSSPDSARLHASPVLSTSPSSASPPAVTNPNAAQVQAHAAQSHSKQDFITYIIAPSLRVEPSAIADVAEASSAQVRYIETGMLSSRVNVNYLVFSFTGAVDSKKLEIACRTLVELHPILRTAFVTYNRRVWMAVLKSADIEFQRHYVSWTTSLNALQEKVIRKDQSIPVDFRTPVTKFMFLDGGKQSVMLLRLSKAQYDDLSIALLVKDLKRLYDGQQPPPQRKHSYCDFVNAVQSANVGGAAEAYWREWLAGASVTQVVHHLRPYKMVTNIKMVKEIIPSLDSCQALGCRVETLLKAAWAMVLATLARSSDVVFGEVIDGRNMKLPGGYPVSRIMGPTVNIIPVRVQFPDTRLTTLELLSYIDAQRQACMPFENMGFLTIVENCTPWVYWTRFSSIVHHQVEERAIIPSEPKTFHLGNAACKFTVHESKAQDLPDLYVRSIARPGGRFEISITFSPDRAQGLEQVAGDALRLLCDTIRYLLPGANKHEPLIPPGYYYRELQHGKIPLSATIPSRGEGEDVIPNWMTPDQVQAIRMAVMETWADILDPISLGVPQEQVLLASFYDLWGSLIPASQMMKQLNLVVPGLTIPGVDASDVSVTMEEIIDNPSIETQTRLIASKCKPKDVNKSKDKVKTTKERGNDDNKDAKSKDLSPPPGPGHKKKPRMTLPILPQSIGSRLKRYASVSRTNTLPNTSRTSSNTKEESNGNSTTQRKPSLYRPPPAPTSPVAIGLASAMVADLSPLMPRVVGSVAPVLNSAPPPRQPGSAPPQIPVFDTIAEESETEEGWINVLTPPHPLLTHQAQGLGSQISLGTSSQDAQTPRSVAPPLPLKERAPSPYLFSAPGSGAGRGSPAERGRAGTPGGGSGSGAGAMSGESVGLGPTGGAEENVGSGSLRG